MQVHDCFGDVVSFIANTGDSSTASKSNLLELLSNPTKSTQLIWNWLYFIADVGDVLVKATYNLEGDVPLTLSTYEHISLSTFATTVHYPNTVDICILTIW